MSPPASALAALLPYRRARARRLAAALREKIDAEGVTADRARALGDALETAGEPVEAITLLTQANRLRPDAALERRLVRLRRRTFRRPRRDAAAAWPPALADDPPGTPAGPLDVEPAALSVDLLRRGILRHGCVRVRGLVPRERVERLRRAIDEAFEARERALARAAMPEDAVWWSPVERVPKDASRHWVRRGQGLLAADSPRAFFEFLDAVDALGLDRLIAGYFGERPALSVEKCTLRRADARLSESTWHQDGAFLGAGIRTVDAWFALSPCGRDAPGLDLVPRRLDRILPTGDGGTYFGWTVSEETIARELPDAGVWRPEFGAGDVLFFDHFLLHRTAADPAMPNVRYAIESWFFAPSTYPKGSTPLIV